MRGGVRTCRAGFVLPVTLVLAGICAMLIAVAYKMVNDGSRAVRTYLGQSCCRLAAQTAMDLFVEKLHAEFNEAVWRGADNETPMYVESGTMYQMFFKKGGLSSSLTDVVDDFNDNEAKALSGTGGDDNENSWVGQFGPRGYKNTKNVQTDIQISLLPISEDDVVITTDKGGSSQYAEVTLRMQATARTPRTGASGDYGATSIIEEKIRFGALGFGTRAGLYDSDIYALPARCFESAINADCPLVFGTCAGNSGWTINGEVRTRGFVNCKSYEGKKVTRIHGELHVATNMPLKTNLPYEKPIPLMSNFGCYAVEDGEILKECVNGANCYMRFPSPGRRRGFDVPVPGSPEWYEYAVCRQNPGDSGVYNGVFKGGYGCWREVEAAIGKGTVYCHTGADAEWFHIPVFPVSKEKKQLVDLLSGFVVPPYYNEQSIGGVLGRYPSPDGSAPGPKVEFAGLPKVRQKGIKTSKGLSATEPLYLIGHFGSPIVLSGSLYWNDDIIIGGFISGHGAIYSGRNIHIVRDLIMLNPPTWRQDQDYDTNARTVNAKADMVALLARGNIVIGNYLDTTRNDSDNVTGFEEKVRRVTGKTESEEQLRGYAWRKKVLLPQGSPLAENTETSEDSFDGNYFTTRRGRPILEPREATDHAGNCVTNLCRPVVRIDAMLCSENAIVGIVGPGDFSWAKSKIDDVGDIGYGEGGLRAGHGMQLQGTALRSRPQDYLMKPGVVFTLNGGMVCRDLAIYLDYDQNVVLDGKRWTPDRVKAIVNWDPRFMADSEDANYLSRDSVGRWWKSRASQEITYPAQNPLSLPTDASPKPQILSWREVSDGVIKANWR